MGSLDFSAFEFSADEVERALRLMAAAGQVPQIARAVLRDRKSVLSVAAEMELRRHYVASIAQKAANRILALRERAHSGSDPLDDLSRSMDISERLRASLLGAGIKTFTAASNLSELALLSIPNFGRVSVNALRAALHARGLDFAPPELLNPHAGGEQFNQALAQYHLWRAKASTAAVNKDWGRHLVAKERVRYWVVRMRHFAKWREFAPPLPTCAPAIPNNMKFTVNSKLDADKVRAIRAGGKSDAEFAAAFGVTEQTISNARSGFTWQHVK